MHPLVRGSRLSHGFSWRRLFEPRLDAPFPLWMIFPVIFVALYATHFDLLRLPYYWDEAGYYIPAAWDFFRISDQRAPALAQRLPGTVVEGLGLHPRSHARSRADGLCAGSSRRVEA